VHSADIWRGGCSSIFFRHPATNLSSFRNQKMKWTYFGLPESQWTLNGNMVGSPSLSLDHNDSKNAAEKQIQP
jgi:hypothetical protein